MDTRMHEADRTQQRLADGVQRLKQADDTWAIGSLDDAMSYSYFNRRHDWEAYNYTLPSPAAADYRKSFRGPTEHPVHPRAFSCAAAASDSLVKPIERFVETLYEKSGMQYWRDYTMLHSSPTRAMKCLEDSLVEFATKLLSIPVAPASSSKNDDERDARLTLFGAVLIRHYKIPIAQYLMAQIFRQFFANVPSVRVSLQQMGPPDVFPERLGLKTKSMIALEDALVKTTVAELEHIPHLLALTDEMRHLALSIRRDLYHDDSFAMRNIQTAMSEENLSRLAGGDYKADIQAYWSIEKFMIHEYGEDIPPFGSIVTLTGSSLYAQASTCADYVKMTWPHTGPFFLELLDIIHNAVVKSNTKAPAYITRTSKMGLSVEADVYCGHLSYTHADFAVYATDRDLLVQFAQQLSWLSSAFTTSPFKNQLAYSSPVFFQQMPGVFFITISHKPIDDSEKACWLPLFDNACIVAEFPVADRAEEIGLEVSLDLLAGLSGARHIVEYEGGLVMKGFSHMFVPVRRRSDRVQWHAVSSNNNETPLSYQDGISRCTSRALLQDVGLQQLKALRAIVGWCSVATVCLGSSHANYENIDYTKANEADSGPRCTGTSLGFQQFGVAALDVKFGLKDGKSHFQRAGPYQRIIQLAENSPIVLHDVEGKRSWLVPATNVMLHIIQHRHHLNPFQVNGKPIDLNTNIATGSSAREVLLKNRTQLLYEDDNYTFMDDILNTWSILEFLLAQNISRQREAPGIRVPTSLHESLYGFEFKAVVLEDAPYKLKKTNINRTHGGWSKLIEDIDALVLFANGFGNVILPAGGSDQVLCHQWRGVPDGQDYLATPTKMLQNLFDKAGSRVDRKYLTTKSKLRWHQGSSTLFNACRDAARCDCTRLQQLVPESTIRSVQPPTSMAIEGAVIFGRPESRPTQSRPTEPPVSNSLYSQPNVSIAQSTICRRDSTIDEAQRMIRQLAVETNELSCESNRRLQTIQ